MNNKDIVDIYIAYYNPPLRHAAVDLSFHVGHHIANINVLSSDKRGIVALLRTDFVCLDCMANLSMVVNGPMAVCLC